MYKILVAGAIVSTLMVIQSKAEEQKATNENTKTDRAELTNNNEQLKSAYEQAKKDIAAHERASSMKKANINKLALIPEEKSISDFPAPLAAEENDPETISAYYDEVAASYHAEAEKAYKEMQRAHQAKEKHKTDNRLKDMRHQDRHQPDDISLNKEGRTVNNKTAPYISARYTPAGIQREGQVTQNKRYRDLKNKYNELEMKHDFYAEVADLMSGQEHNTINENENSN